MGKGAKARARRRAQHAGHAAAVVGSRPWAEGRVRNGGGGGAGTQQRRDSCGGGDASCSHGGAAAFWTCHIHDRRIPWNGECWACSPDARPKSGASASAVARERDTSKPGKAARQLAIADSVKGKGEALALREELDDIKARAEESARAAAVATHTMKEASVRG